MVTSIAVELNAVDDALILTVSVAVVFVVTAAAIVFIVVVGVVVAFVRYSRKNKYFDRRPKSFKLSFDVYKNP